MQQSPEQTLASELAICSAGFQLGGKCGQRDQIPVSRRRRQSSPFKVITWEEDLSKTALL